MSESASTMPIRGCFAPHPALNGQLSAEEVDALDDRERVACVLVRGHAGPHEFIPEDER